MKNSFRARGFAPALSVLSLAVAASLHAQTIELDPVVVSATRIEQKLSDVIPSATVITREEIESSQAPTLIDLIQGQPGVEIGRNGGPGSVASIFMRGQASNNVAVFIDGIPVQRDALGGLKLIDIPPSQIEKIEILRGNMGSVYGESAVGGAIHVFTRARTDKSGPTATVFYGSRNTSDLTLGYNLNNDDYKLGFSILRHETDGYSAMNPGQNSFVNPDDDALTRESIFVKGEKIINERIEIGFQWSRIEGSVEYDRDFNPFSNSDALPTDLQISKQKSSDLSVYTRFKLGTDWSSRIAVTQSDYENRDFYNGAVSDAYDGNQIGLQWSNTYKFGIGIASIGIDSTDAEFEIPTKYKRHSLGYFVGYSGRYDQFDYQANLRRDQIKAKTSDAAKDSSANTWLFGGGYNVTDFTKFIGLVSTSFRAPAVSDLFGVPSWGQNPNPDLEPSEHKGGEFGIQHQSVLGTLRAIYFKTATKNDFEWKNSQINNIAQTENEGVELGLSGALLGWNYKLSAVTQDPKNAQSGQRLVRRAKEYGSIDLTKSVLGIDWGTKLLWSGNRMDGTKTLGSYTVVNFSAAKTLTTDWTGRLKVENAFNEKYQLVNGYDAVPRGVFFTLQYQPK